MLAADANNTVYALARDLADAPELVELAAKAPHKNVHTGKLDLLDVQSIKVCICVLRYSPELQLLFPNLVEY